MLKGTVSLILRNLEKYEKQLNMIINPQKIFFFQKPLNYCSDYYTKIGVQSVWFKHMEMAVNFLLGHVRGLYLGSSFSTFNLKS